MSGIGGLPGELRSQRRLVTLRETQLGQVQQIQALDAEMRQGFATVLTAVQAIAGRLDDRPGGNG